MAEKFLISALTGDSVTGTEVTAGLGSINLELAQKITAMNENVGFSNTISDMTYTPVWQEVTRAGDDKAIIRVMDPLQLDVVGQAIDTFEVTNPDFIVTTTLGDERVFNFTFNFVNPINGVRFEFYADGSPDPSWRSPAKDITGTGLQQIGTIDLGGGRYEFEEPFDVFAGDYRIRLYSEEGDVVVKSNNVISGTTFKPYYTFDGRPFTDTLTNPFTDADETKLDGIEAGAEINPTAGEIKTLYESNADTNAFTDSYKSQVDTNTAKVTNATHTGEVTGSGVLTADPTIISNKSLVTAASGMELLANDSGTLKKVDADDFLGSFTDKFKTQITFVKNANLSVGDYMVIGEITTSATNGWIVPQDMTLKTVTISRADSDASDLEVVCDGVVLATVATSATETVTDVTVSACSKGDIIAVRNKSTGSIMSNTLCVLWFEGTI